MQHETVIFQFSIWNGVIDVFSNPLRDVHALYMTLLLQFQVQEKLNTEGTKGSDWIPAMVLYKRKKSSKELSGRIK